MIRRIVQFGLLMGVITAPAGCDGPGAPQVVPQGSTAPAPAPPGAETPQVQVHPLTADQLAQILGVNVWTAKYSGGPVECWLEVEEEGQSTMPKRIPEKDFLGAGTVNPPAKGSIELWWMRREDRQGGELTIHAANGSYGLGLAKDAFTFAWQSFSAQSTPTGQGEVLKGEPGKEFVVVDYDAKESLPGGDKRVPRRVHLKLMGRFAVPK